LRLQHETKLDVKRTKTAQASIKTLDSKVGFSDLLGGASSSQHVYPFSFSTIFQFTFPQLQRTLAGFLSTVARRSIPPQLLHTNKL